MKIISFVIPCYRSENTIKQVIEDIVAVVQNKDTYDYEIICVNDESPDDVYLVLQELARQNSRVKVINLSRNMGKACAVMAGLNFVHGDYIVNLDDDGQCPVKDLWALIVPLEIDECDIATASYFEKKQALWKNIGSDINVLMGRVMLGKPEGLRIENFSAMKRFVADEMVKYNLPYPYLEGLILRVTKRIKMVPMEENSRLDGNDSGFTFSKSLSLWINGFTAFSVKPLRIATIVGAISAIAGIVYGILKIIIKLFNPTVIQAGYTSLLVVMLFIGGLVLMCLGLVGEYVGRIYISINKSPQYVIREKINI